MKRIIIAITVVAFALVSCAKFEDEPKVNFGEISAPVVTLEVTGDNSVHIEVAAGANTGYYAFSLLAGDVSPLKVDPEQLLAGKLGGIKDVVANAAEADTLKADVDKLDANSKYTLVAVAANKETHNLSEISFKTVTTTDATAPAYDDYDYLIDGKNLIFAVEYDDPISITDTASLFVRTFGANYDYGAGYYYQLRPINTVVIPADSILVEDNVVYVSVPVEAYYPGEWVALFIGEGSFVNELGAVNAKFDENVIYGEPNTKYSEGIIARFDTVPFELECPIAEDSVYKFQDVADCNLVLEAKYYGTLNARGAYGEGGVTVSLEHAVSGRTITYALSDWEANAAGNLKLGADEAPELGYYVSYNVDEDCIQDLYGNPNAATTIEKLMLCSYGYALADVIGTYDVAGYDLLADADSSIVVKIAASDNAEKGNVVLELFGYSGAYGNFDGDLGTITVGKQKVTKESTQYNLGFYFESVTSATLSFPAAGMFKSTDYWCIDNGRSYLDAFTLNNGVRQ